MRRRDFIVSTALGTLGFVVSPLRAQKATR